MKFSIEGDNNRSIGALGNNLTGLKNTLLSNFERLEAVLLEAKFTTFRLKLDRRAILSNIVFRPKKQTIRNFSPRIFRGKIPNLLIL